MSKPFEVQEAERVIAEVQAQLADTITITISREAVELMADPTYIVPILDHDPISVVIYACRAALEGER